jgi:hypothetical protein
MNQLNDPLWLVVSALAVYRLTRLITDDLITEPLRKAIEHLGEPWATGIECAWCVSVWVCAGSVAMWLLIPALWHVLAVVLALSAVAGLITEHTN